MYCKTRESHYNTVMYMFKYYGLCIIRVEKNKKYKRVIVVYL